MTGVQTCALPIYGKAIAGRWHTYPEKTAAGLWTTPSELARWVMEIQKPGKALQAETVKTMLTKSAGDYGLGIGLGETAGRASFSHGGANEDAAFILEEDPSLVASSVFFTAGHRSFIQSFTFSGSRSRACLAGRCRVQSIAPRIFHT